MIYNATILSLGTPLNRVTAEIDEIGWVVTVWLPSVISRLPVVDDSIMVQLDDAELNDYAEFVCYSNESSAVPIGSQHTHQMLSDETIDNMELPSAEKDMLRTKSTGGVR